jgi:hypothetical protein
MSSITDSPISKLEQDFLSVEKYAKSLSKFIIQSDTPITIGLQGEWGTGKTSLMSLLLEQFNRDENENQIASSWVNTWEYSMFRGVHETTPSVLKGMLEKLKESCGDHWTILHEADDKIRKATRFFGNLANQVIANQTGVDLKDAAGSSSDSRRVVAEIAEIKKLISDLIQELINHEENPVKKVVFFVDDLDRIQPSDAVEVLESLKNIFDIPNCVFILAIDYDVVVKGLESKFGPKTKENEREFRSFFDKIIQVPFSMPVGAYNINSFLKNKLLDLDVQVTDEEVSHITKIVSYTVGSNPRSLKRYLNTFSLIKIIVDDNDDEEQEVNKIVLFAVLGIQISYPKIFRLLTQNSNYLDWDKSFGNKINLDLDEVIAEIQKVGESELTNEPWEQILWGVSQQDRYLKVKVFNILELFNFWRELFGKKKETLHDELIAALEFAAITNVDDDLEAKQSSTKVGSVTYFEGFDFWIKEMRNGQNANPTLGIKKRKPVEIDSETESFFLYWKNHFESEGYELIFTPTGGCSVKHKKTKIANLGFKGTGNNKSSKVAVMILRDFKRDYKRPIVQNLSSENLRKYDPNVKSYQLPWGKEFYELSGEINDFTSNTGILKQLFKDAEETVNAGKKLKVNKDNHYILEEIYNGSFDIN